MGCTNSTAGGRGITNRLVDVIGYYGQAGNVADQIPKLADINENYNVIIFAFITGKKGVTLELLGPYKNDMAGLKTDIAAWKAVPDKYGRQKLALVSFGGQGGAWSYSTHTSDAILSFLIDYNMDGIDIDLESTAAAICDQKEFLDTMDALKAKSIVITAAPEAAQARLDSYKLLLQKVTWAHPQFYNNPPNAVTVPYVPSAWPNYWTVTDWQAEDPSLGAFWAAVLSSIGSADSLNASQLGMCCPASKEAASSYNDWDMDTLKTQVAASSINRIATWSITCDKVNGYKFATNIGSLNA